MAAPPKPAAPIRSSLAEIKARIDRRREDPATKTARATIRAEKAALYDIEKHVAKLTHKRMTRERLTPAQLMRIANLRRDFDAAADRIYDARAALRARALAFDK